METETESKRAKRKYNERKMNDTYLAFALCLPGRRYIAIYYIIILHKHLYIMCECVVLFLFFHFLFVRLLRAMAMVRSKHIGL